MFSEVQKYVNLTAHVDSWSYVVFGEKQFQMLPEDLRKVIVKCALEMQNYEHQIHVEEEQQIKEQLISRGMEFIEVDKAAFSSKARPVLYQNLSPEMQKLYEEIQNLQ